MGDAWDDLVRAHREYLDAITRLFKGDPTPRLRAALAFAIPTPPGRDVALQALMDLGASRPDVVADLVPELFEFAIGADFRSSRVRRMLTRLEPRTLETRLAPVVDQFLESGSRDASDYWGLIELLHEAGLVTMRTRVIDAALRSADSDTRATAQRWANDLIHQLPDLAK